MKWRAIYAVFQQDLYITKASLEVILDIFVFTLVNILLFGFLSTYLAQSADKLLAESLLLAVVFWEVIRITQYSMSVSTMWNVWSHNLCNMFIAPIQVHEYLLAHFLSAATKSFLLLVSAFILAYYVFGLNILGLGLFPVAFSYLNMVIFGTGLGLVLIGLVFRFGVRIQALTWGTIYLIQPLCAVFFPVHVLPSFLQPVAYAFPVTYFFEWLRALHTGGFYSSPKVFAAFVFNICFLAVCAYVFSRLLAASKQSGQLVRNDL